MEPAKLHAKYIGHDGDNGYEQAKKYDLWLVQVPWPVTALTGHEIEVWRRSPFFLEGDGVYEKRGLIAYKSIQEFFTNWTEIKYER